MRRKLATVLVLATALIVAPHLRSAEMYRIDPVHSGVSFKIRHLVSNVSGRFSDFEGGIQADREDLARSSVAFTIKTSSIDTGNGKRDDHLRSPDFFDAAKYPEIAFKSTKVEKASGDTYNVTGSFTMHGVTKDITIPVQVLGFTSHPRFGDLAGFSTSFKLNRKDYGISWNAPMDASTLVLGDDVQVEINIEAAKPKEEAKEAPKEQPKAAPEKEKK